MRSLALVVVLAVAVSGCSDGSSGDADDGKTQSSLGASDSAASAAPLEYEAPTWQPGMRWSFDVRSGPDNATAAGTTRLHALGSHEVAGKDYQVLLSLEGPSAAPSLAFIDAQQTTKTVGASAEVDCRGVRSCLDDPGLGAALAAMPGLPLPVFPVREGRTFDVRLPIHGLLVEGSIRMGDAHDTKLPAGTLPCIPIAVDATITTLSGAPISSGPERYRLSLEYCDDARTFGRAYMVTTTRLADGNVTETASLRELADYALEGEPVALDRVGRSFAAAARPAYEATFTGLPGEASDAQHSVVIALEGNRTADQVHVQHIAPDGAVVASSDTARLDTTFAQPGIHRVAVTVTGPQGILMLQRVAHVGVGQDVTGSGTCTAGTTGVPALDGACEPLRLGVPAGLVAIDATASHAQSPAGGQLSLVDADGALVAEAEASGDAASLHFVPTGAEADGEWILQWQPAYSLGGTVDYAVVLEAPPTVVQDVTLPPVDGVPTG